MVHKGDFLPPPFPTYIRRSCMSSSQPPSFKCILENSCHVTINIFSCLFDWGISISGSQLFKLFWEDKQSWHGQHNYFGISEQLLSTCPLVYKQLGKWMKLLNLLIICQVFTFSLLLFSFFSLSNCYLESIVVFHRQLRIFPEMPWVALQKFLVTEKGEKYQAE